MAHQRYNLSESLLGHVLERRHLIEPSRYKGVVVLRKPVLGAPLLEHVVHAVEFNDRCVGVFRAVVAKDHQLPVPGRAGEELRVALVVAARVRVRARIAAVDHPPWPFGPRRQLELKVLGHLLVTVTAENHFDDSVRFAEIKDDPLSTGAPSEPVRFGRAVQNILWRTRRQPGRAHLLSGFVREPSFLRLEERVPGRCDRLGGRAVSLGSLSGLALLLAIEFNRRCYDGLLLVLLDQREDLLTVGVRCGILLDHRLWLLAGRVLEVRVGTIRQQQLGQLDAKEADGDVERRVARHSILRSGVHPMVQKQLHHLLLAGPGGFSKRPRRLHNLVIMIEKKRDDLAAVIPRGHVKRRFAEGVGGVRVAASVQQHHQHVRPPKLASMMKRRRALLITDLDVSLVLEEGLHHGFGPLRHREGGEGERRVSLGIGRVDVGAVCCEALHHFQIASQRADDKGSVALVIAALKL
mmetsp:Transcript_1485/g.4875  ORF Transcript_1485/g.4875 Transcript_1485/m.4875 type:complete len:466 (+) Transcript_1485:879-2276(+)